MGTSHEDLCTLMIMSLWILFWINNVSGICCTEYQNTILCTVTFLTKSCRLWDIVERRGKDGQATNNNRVRHMRFAYWITKVTRHTISIRKTCCFSAGKKVKWTLLILRLYVHCLSCYFTGPKTDSVCDSAPTLYFSYTKAHQSKNVTSEGLTVVTIQVFTSVLRRRKVRCICTNSDRLLGVTRHNMALVKKKSRYDW